jgi:phosphomannomutase
MSCLKDHNHREQISQTQAPLKRNLSCFKAYDVRGHLGEELNEEIAWKIGYGFGHFLQKSKGLDPSIDPLVCTYDKNSKEKELSSIKPEDKMPLVVLGHDIRPSSPILKEKLAQGLCQQGVRVIDLGLTGTEEVYFATIALKADGGLQVTGSHNPIEYNGIKFVIKDAQPLSSDKGLPEIQRFVESLPLWTQDGQITIENGTIGIPPYNDSKTDYVDLRNLKQADISSILEAQHALDPKQKRFSFPFALGQDYIDYLLNYIRLDCLQPMTIVVNGGNGMAGPILEVLAKHLNVYGIKLILVDAMPDGNFPYGIPNPMIQNNRTRTIQAILAHKANFGVAFDGDFDRCFFFDGQGNFIEGYYIVGLLAEAFLKKQPESTIVMDPRLLWNTLDIVQRYSGHPVICRAGHAFIKETMRQKNAIYGGEMSAHHYFKDFSFCDSGMIPWLIVMELLSKEKKTLQDLIKSYQNAFPCSGEINYCLKEGVKGFSILEQLRSFHKQNNGKIEEIDGLSVEYPQWRFNVRCSNTEPLLRLNLETRASASLLKDKTMFLDNSIRKFMENL